METTRRSPTSRSSASGLTSEIEEAEKKKLAEDIKNGLQFDRERYATKLLVQEIDFFMAKKTEVQTKMRELLDHRDKLVKASQASPAEIDDITAKLNGHKLSEKLFDKQISVAVYELRTRGNRNNLKVMLYRPVQLTPETWEGLIKEQGLESYKPKALTAN